MIDENWTWEFYGYHSDNLSIHSGKPVVAQCNNCYKYRIIRYDNYRDLCMRCAQSSRQKTKKIANGNKPPADPNRNVKRKHLHSYSNDGFQIITECKINIMINKISIYTSHSRQPYYNRGSVNNTQCALYLGVDVAEQLLSKVFKNVERMPKCNAGFDFICGKGYKIDVKSSATGYKGFWHFNIKKNKIADHFLLIAFEDRGHLNPMHLWMIPGDVVNHISGLRISKHAVDKWHRYEMVDKIDKVIACCNEMKSITSQ